jgi:hypothetical protein
MAYWATGQIDLGDCLTIMEELGPRAGKILGQVMLPSSGRKDMYALRVIPK